jgi:hypothetical protein
VRSTRRAQPGSKKYACKENENARSPADNLSPICLVHRFAHFSPASPPKTSVAHVTPVEMDDQDRCASEPCNAISSQLRGTVEVQDALIERLRDNESKIEKSLRQLSRLLLDGIVENLSRTALQT